MPQPNQSNSPQTRLDLAEAVCARHGLMVASRISGKIDGDAVFSKAPQGSDSVYELVFSPPNSEKSFKCALDIHGNVVRLEGLDVIHPHSAEQVLDYCLQRLHAAPKDEISFSFDAGLLLALHDKAHTLLENSPQGLLFDLSEYSWGERPTVEELATIASILSATSINPLTREVIVDRTLGDAIVDAYPGDRTTLVTCDGITVRFTVSATGSSVLIAATSDRVNSQFQLLRLDLTASQAGEPRGVGTFITPEIIEVRDLTPDALVAFDCSCHPAAETLGASSAFGRELYRRLDGLLQGTDTFSNLTLSPVLPIVLVAREAGLGRSIGMLLFNADSTAAIRVDREGRAEILYNEGEVSATELRAAARFPQGEALAVETRLGSGWAGLVDRGCFQREFSFLSRDDDSPLVRQLRHEPDGEIMRNWGRMRPHIPTASQLDRVEQLLAAPFVASADLEQRRQDGDIVVTIRGAVDPHSQGRTLVFVRAIQELAHGAFACLDIEGRNIVARAAAERGQMFSPQRGYYVGELMFPELVPGKSYSLGYLF
ncbi:MAG: hypothetical protein QY326_03555 [Bdellovibrionota bacterium]|nr:MAG: hypothetical protein QY326_03555 [Bdellovibrionota bacterium]